MAQFGSRLLLVFVLAVAMVVSVAVPQASAEFHRKESKVIRVGYFDAGRMMIGATGEGGHKSGYAYEYLQEMAIHTGWRYEYVTGTFREILEMLFRGEVDIVPMLSRTEERLSKMYYPEQAFGMEYFFLATLKERIGEFRNVKQGLEGKKIGVDAGYAENRFLEAFLKENNIHAEIVGYPTTTKKIEALRKLEVDATLNSNNAVPQDLMLIQAMGSMPCYIGVSMKRPDVLEEMNAAAKAMDLARPGYLSYLTQKYFFNTPMSRQFTEEETAWLKEHPVIRVGSIVDNFPYAYAGENGKPVGSYIEAVRLMVERLGLNNQVEWVLYNTRQEMNDALQNKKVDIIAPEYHDYYDADVRDILVSNIIDQTVMGALVKGTVTINSMDVIATSDSRLGVSYVRDNYPNSKVIICKTVKECVEKVESGEATAAVAHTVALDRLLKETVRSSSGYSIIPLSTVCDVCFASRRNENYLIRLMNRGIHFVSKEEVDYLTMQHQLQAKNNVSAVDFFRSHMEYPLAFLVLVCSLVVAGYALRRSGISERNLALANVQIKQTNEHLESLVSERTEALEEALKTAEEASKSKTTFLFNMSHDIRTPMNAILGFTNMAQKDSGNQAKVEDCLNKVESAGRHLLGLINDILEMARIENGKLEIEEKVVNLLEQKGKTTAMVDSLAAEKQISFIKEYINVDTDQFMWLDTVRIDQVLLNVISNAIKYTPAGGTVRYTLESLPGDDAEHGRLRFTVKDNGIGMSEEFVKTIFENFSRERSSTVSGIQGAGLGMAIVKRIVDTLGGTITVESKLGEGTKIVIELAPRLADRVAEAAGKDTETGGADLAGLKVLLVEDNELNREIAGEILRDFGIEVEEAGDGTEAVSKMAKAVPGQFDIVLMDIQMPIMDGYRATREIRQLPDKTVAAVPIVAMTANAFAEDKKRAEEAGMNDHIAKPIDIARLQEVLAKYAGRRA